MSDILNILLMAVMFVSGAWLMAKVFACIYVAANYPLIKLAEVATCYVPHKHERMVSAGFTVLLKSVGYYLACIWPALIITWLIIPNVVTAPWWMYGIALGGFLTAKCIDSITVSAFALFCLKPDLIEVIYGWVPFNAVFTPPW
ncbi:MAG: hypothetical protein WCF65_08505 [Parachlamydiaceae bacterium]